MRIAGVYRNGILAGRLKETDDRTYTFKYDREYFRDQTKPGISLTLPKSQREYHSDHLFPFFYNMLSEGSNKILQCRQLRIDENDHFALLLATAQIDTIGAITVKPVSSK